MLIKLGRHGFTNVNVLIAGSDQGANMETLDIDPEEADEIISEAILLQEEVLNSFSYTTGTGIDADKSHDILETLSNLISLNQDLVVSLANVIQDRSLLIQRIARLEGLA